MPPWPRGASRMAQLQEFRPGRYRVRFYFERRKRDIYLPRIPKKQATSILEKVERLVESRQSGEPPPGRVIEWLAACGSDLHGRLVAAGLTKARHVDRQLTLDAFLDDYIRKHNAKPSTLRNYDRGRKALLDYFGADRPLESITAGDADQYAGQLTNSTATNALMIKLARQFFRAAVRHEHIPRSPFAEVAAGSMKNTSRQQFIDQDTVRRILGVCPDISTRTALALARFGGLRHPSETLALKITDLDWSENRLRVDSPKTGLRFVPLFPELRPWLVAAFEAAEPGAEFLIPCRKESTIYSRSRSAQHAAGIQRWPRAWHNLRASRQTELEDRFPGHVACAWIGNSEKVARDHYLMTTSDHFRAAVGEAHKAHHQEAHPQAHPQPTEGAPPGAPPNRRPGPNGSDGADSESTENPGESRSRSPDASG